MARKRRPASSARPVERPRDTEGGSLQELALEDLRSATDLAKKARQMQDEAAARARQLGASWTLVGRAALMSTQGAMKRWGTRRA
jgi:hypothetical protein